MFVGLIGARMVLPVPFIAGIGQRSVPVNPKLSLPSASGANTRIALFVSAPRDPQHSPRSYMYRAPAWGTPPIAVGEAQTIRSPVSVIPEHTMLQPSALSVATGGVTSRVRSVHMPSLRS